MQRLQQTLRNKNLLSIYFTVHYPFPESALTILTGLQEGGADMIELGIPFSDPLADGPTIQAAHTQALANTFSIAQMFDELKEMRQTIHIPVVVMGYFNTILQYGTDRFLQQLAAIEIDGIIVPDLPLDVYQHTYKSAFEKYKISFIPILTPTSTAERVEKIYAAADSFVYLLSSSSTTGKQLAQTNTLELFFNNNKRFIVKPTLIGFGIRTKSDFEFVCRFGQGGIIGSKFIEALATATPNTLKDICKRFASSYK